MSWKSPPKGWSAPGTGRDHALGLPGVDERLVQPEMRGEYVGGIEMFAAPANPPHAMDHARLAYVLGSVVKTSYRFAVDMLTRTTEVSDFAPDASVFAMGAKAGKRKLEELAFEVADEQPIGVPTNKARILSKRGVRRIFCILVKPRRVLEWDHEADTWKNLPHESTIEDPCFAAPLEVGALLDAALADDNVARALLARGAKPIEEALERRHSEGRAEGELDADRRSIRELCEVLEVSWTAERAAEVERLGADALRALRTELVRERRWPPR
jgi:hypothetical protein